MYKDASWTNILLWTRFQQQYLVKEQIQNLVYQVKSVFLFLSLFVPVSIFLTLGPRLSPAWALYLLPSK